MRTCPDLARGRKHADLKREEKMLENVVSPALQPAPQSEGHRLVRPSKLYKQTSLRLLG